jgi:superfamily II DNA or RNA helicase
MAGRSVYMIPPLIHNFEILPDDSLYIPRGYKANLYSMMNEFGIQADITDNRTRFDPICDINSSMIQYRPYQYKAVADLVKSEEGVLVAPAGSGKTVIGLSLVPLFGQPTLWLTHTGPLADQVTERIKSFLPSLSEDDIGCIGRGKWKIGNVITVAMVQTLARRLETLYKIRDAFGLLILDEAHHCPASTFFKVIECFNPYYLYGLTATPYRRDKLENLMFQMLGNTVANITVEELDKSENIIIPKVKYKTFYHNKPIHENQHSKILKDHIIFNKKRNHMIVGDVLIEAAAGNYCIVLSDRKAHCEILYSLISIGWDKTGIATGNLTKKENDEQIRKLIEGETTVLVCTNQLLGEGFDFAPLNRAFIASPFRFEGKCEQVIGRIQRIAPGKVDAIVYDYVDADIGVLQNQFYGKGSCRYKAYDRLGALVEPC